MEGEELEEIKLQEKQEKEELLNNDNEQDKECTKDISNLDDESHKKRKLIRQRFTIDMDSFEANHRGLRYYSPSQQMHLSLHEIARNGDLHILQSYLGNLSAFSLKQLINALDENHMSPLHYAARYNHVGITAILLENGAKINIKGSDEILPLHVAARYRRGARKESLLPTFIDETDSAYVPKTVIELLVSKGANVNCMDKYGMTPLHYAAMRGNDMAAKELLKCQDVNIEARDKQFMTPIHLAANYGNYEIASMLIEAGCSLDVYDEGLATPLHKATAAGHIDIVELILSTIESTSSDRLKEAVSSKDQDENTPLHFAVEKGHLRIVKLLLEQGADVDCLRKSYVFPLHLAAIFGNLEIVQLLITYGAKVNCLTMQQETPLHKAAAFNHKDVISYLLNQGARIECRNNEHFTPLVLAAREGHIDAIKELLKNGADIEAVDKNDKTVVYWLSEENHPNELKAFLTFPSASDLINKGDCYDNNPLHIAAKLGFDDVAKILLENGADINSKNEEEQTALHLATENGHRSIIKLFLDYNKSIVNVEDEEYNTALHIAALKGHQKIVKDLLNAGANIESRNCNLWTALDCAASEGWLKTTRILLKAGSPVDPMDKAKTTPLHLAAQKGHYKVVEILLKSGAKIDQLDAAHNNCLDLAIKGNHREATLKILDDKNWETVLRNWTNSKKFGKYQTPLRKLIEYMPDVAEHLFDKFITNNGFSSDHQKFAVYYNYEFLDDMFANYSDFEKNDIYDESGNIKYGSQLYSKKKEKLKRNHPLMLMVSLKRQLLLNHPICCSLLNHKWKSYGRYVYYLNLLVYIFFLMFYTGHILANRPPCPEYLSPKGHCCRLTNATECPHALGNCTEDHSFTKRFYKYNSRYAIFFLAAVHLLKELFQFYESGLHYFNVENLMEWCCYVTALLFTIDFSECSHNTGLRSQWQWNIGGISIFLAWMVLVLFIRKFHILGIYVVMFTDILSTFVRFFIVFFLFIVAFSLGFYTLLRNQDPFETPSESILKTTVMMIGEMEFDTIFNDPDNPIYFKGPTYILFVIFLILMPIIIMNLLVGLAVDDIKGVQEQAEFGRMAMKVKLVLRIENVLPAWTLYWCVIRKKTVYPNCRSLSNRILTWIWSQNQNASASNEYFKSKIDHIQEKQETIARQFSSLQENMRQLRRQNKEIKQLLAKVSEQSQEESDEDR